LTPDTSKLDSKWESRVGILHRKADKKLVINLRERKLIGKEASIFGASYNS
jgi:hypothetical protein